MTQSEAFRLADALEHDAATQKIYHRPLVDASAAELRRLHEELERERMRPARWIGLTRDEKVQLAGKIGTYDGVELIEAALKEKNS